MRNIISILFLVSLMTRCAFASEEAQEPLNADTLQGLTSSAFMTTNDFESLKVTIEKLKSSAEACADGIVDLQLGLSTLSHEERIIREKDLNKIIEDYSKISFELVSISSAENQGDRSGETYALQSDLEELASELLSLQNYVQTYFGHIRSENEQWYFTATGGLTGTNNSMTSSSSFSQYMLLVGQSFRTKANSVVSFVKIKLPLGTQPSPDKVFISPYSSTLTTNDFTYADAISTNEAPIYTYYFPNYHTTALTPYVFGIRTTEPIPISVYRTNDGYVDDFGFSCYGSNTRYNADQGTYSMTLEYQYDLCFDIGFIFKTNIVIGSNGIEIKNDASLKIDGKRVATVQEVIDSIAEASQSIYYALSNHVFGTASIANNSITTEKIANNAVTTEKLSVAGVTNSKIANDSISGDKIQSNAISSFHILDYAITSEKHATNSIQLSHFTEPLKSNLILSSGGTVTGKLEVTQLRIINNGSWHIGTVTNRSDIIIDHPEACISSLYGNLNLAASAGNNIKMQSFLELVEGQCGLARILEGTSFGVISNNLSTNAIINVTPLQDPGARYWVNIDCTGQATINMSGIASDDLDFYFIIMKK